METHVSRARTTESDQAPAHRRQRGIALILFVVLLPIVLGLVGLAVDYGVAVSASQQARGQARLLALAALEQFYEATGNGLTRSEALNRALQRVDKLAQQNVASGSKRTANSVYYPWNRPADDEQVAELVPGRFFVSYVPLSVCQQYAGLSCSGVEPQCIPREKLPYTINGGSPDEVVCNPCAGSNRDEPPCFVPVTSRAQAENVEIGLTAFQLRARLFEGVSARFARALIGDVTLPLNVSAVASIVPRRVIALVDISGSSTRETHLSRGVQGQQTQPEFGRGSLYAFRNDPAFPYATRDFSMPNTETDWLQVPQTRPTGSMNSDAEHAQWHFLRHWTHNSHDFRTGSYGQGTTRASNQAAEDPIPETPRVHFYDDYQLVQTAGNDNRGAWVPDPNKHPIPAHCDDGDPSNDVYCTAQEQYLVDAVSRPEPLETIFGGLREVVRILRQRRVAGDELGMILFEKLLTWPRIISLTSDFDYVQSIVADTPQARELRARLKYFPGRDAFTDLPDAVSEAFSHLRQRQSEVPGLPSKDDIILITDGLTNCADCYLPSGRPWQFYDMNNDGQIDIHDLMIFLACFRSDCVCSQCFTSIQDLMELLQAMSGACALTCADTYEFYESSIKQLFDILTQTQGSNVAINVLAIGGHVGPNWVDVTAPGQTQCLTDDEARRLNIVPVKQGCSEEGCERDYELRSNLRPFTRAVENLYYIARMTGGEFTPILESPPGCIPDPDSCTPGMVRTVDRSCRSTAVQINDFMDKLLNQQTPFAIVESD